MGSVQVLILGPVGLGVGEEILRPSSAVAARLLAVLATRPGRPVPDDVLREQVWPGDPGIGGPRLAVTVHRLRTWLKAVAGSAVRIARDRDGYLLDGDPDAVDMARFTRLVAAARQVDQQERTAMLAEALRLWRGRLPDAVEPAIAAALERTRGEAIAEHARLVLASGQASAALTIVDQAAHSYPLDEDLLAVRIEALAKAGRRAEALSVYHEFRRQLRNELGVHPGRGAQAALSTVLADDRLRFAPPTGLPAPAPQLRSRARQLAELYALLAASDPNVVTITGQGGCGKTALATRWAHQIAEEFPDGQVFVDLRATSGTPVTPLRALTHVLRVLGESETPSDVDAASTVFRSVTARQKVLLVLDDAGSTEQVRPLLPASPTSFVVVTSRSALHELGATRVELDPLPTDAAA